MYDNHVSLYLKLLYFSVPKLLSGTGNKIICNQYLYFFKTRTESEQLFYIWKTSDGNDTDKFKRFHSQICSGVFFLRKWWWG